jgi:hypothetical protein
MAAIAVVVSKLVVRAARKKHLKRDRNMVETSANKKTFLQYSIYGILSSHILSQAG